MDYDHLYVVNKGIYCYIRQGELSQKNSYTGNYIKLSKFDKDFKNTMLIGGGWSLRGRENKINHIMKHFN